MNKKLFVTVVTLGLLVPFAFIVLGIVLIFGTGIWDAIVYASVIEGFALLISLLANREELFE